MLEALQVAAFPFVAAWRVCEAVWACFKWVYKICRARRRKPAYGDARWASARELAAAGHFERRGFPVGKLKGRWVYAHHEANVVMFGIAGAGKSLTQGATFHQASGESLIGFDPKGEHHRSFAEPLRIKGYEVFHIDLDNPLNGARYDPMAFFEESGRYDFDRDHDTLARLVVGDAGEREGAEVHFTEMSASLIGGVLAHLRREHPEKASLAHVADILSVGGPTKRKTAFDQMAAGAADDITRIAINAFNEAGDREKGSFATTLSRKLRPWVTPQYRDLCRPDPARRWTWESILLNDSPVAFFITGGLGQRDMNAPFLRVLFGQATASIARLYNKTREPLPRPVKFLIDEADLVSGCKPLVDLVTQLRSAKASAFLSYQAPNQVKRNFGPMADTLLSNCDLLITGALKTPQDYLDLSKLIGSRTVKTVSKGGAGSSESETGRHLFAIEDFYRLGKNEHVALLRNLPVLVSKPYAVRRGAIAYE